MAASRTIGKTFALFAIVLMVFTPIVLITEQPLEGATTEVRETIHISYYDQWEFDKDMHVPGLTLENNVLTMDNVNVSMVHRDLMRAMSINQAEVPLKIIVKGNNVISHVNTTEAEHSYTSCALYSRAPIEIVGEGNGATLTLNTSDRSNFAYGLLIERATKISNVKIICNADTSLEKSEAIHSDGTVTMEGVVVEANTGQSKITAGVNAAGVTLNLKDSAITTNVGEASVSSRGIVARSVIGSNSSVSAIAGKVTGTGDSIGLELDCDDSRISGAKVVATGGESASKSYGIFFTEQCNENAITDARVICTGFDSAIATVGPSACDRSVFGQNMTVEGYESLQIVYHVTIESGSISLDYKKVRSYVPEPSDNTNMGLIIAIIVAIIVLAAIIIYAYGRKDC